MVISPAALKATVYSVYFKCGKKRRLNSPPSQRTPPPPRSPILRQRTSPFPRTFNHIKSDISDAAAAANCNTGVLHLSTSTGSEDFHFWVTDRSLVPQLTAYFREEKGLDTSSFTPYSSVATYTRNYHGMAPLHRYHLNRLPIDTTQVRWYHLDRDTAQVQVDVEGDASDDAGAGSDEESSVLYGLSFVPDDSFQLSEDDSTIGPDGEVEVENEDDDVSAAVAVAALPIEYSRQEPSKRKSTFASGGQSTTNKKMRVERPFHPGYSSSKKKRALHLRGNGGRRRRGRKQKLATGTGPMIFPVIENEAAPPVADILNNGAPDELEVAEENEAAPPVADILLEVGTNEELQVAEALVEFGAAVADVEEEVVEDAALIANVVVAAAAEEETVDAGEEVVDSNGEAGEVVAARNANGRKWMVKYQLLVQYKEEHGSCDVPQSTNGLGLWVKKVRVVVLLTIASDIGY